MADITQLPDLGIAQFEQVGYENPRLAAPIDEDDTTLTFTAPLKDEDNTQFNKAIIIGVKNLETKYTENIYIPAGGMSSDGLTATGCIRGLQLSGVNGIDITTTVTANAIAHPQDSEVRVIVSAHLIQAILKTLFGSIATGGNDFIMGKATNEIVTIHHKDGSSTKGFLRKHPTSAKVQFSNDGSAWVNLDAAGVGTITWGDGLAGGSGNANPYVELANTPAFLTGGASAESNSATWAAVTNGSFRVTVDGTAYNVDAINFTGVASMANVASTIQTALRAVTGSTETVVWDTDHFVITSVNYTSSSQISVLSTSTGTVGTDISGAGASAWMDAETGRGTATALVEASGLTMSSGRLMLLKTVIQNSTWSYAADAQASDTYAITLSPAPAAYAVGQSFTFKANTANTGAATLNVNALGAKTLKKFTDQDLETGDIEAGSIIEVEYDGTNFQITSILASQLSTSEINTLKGGASTNADSLHTHSFSKRIASVRTPVTVTATTTETNLVSETIPANSLGTLNAIRVRLHISDCDIINTDSLTIRCKYGASTFISMATTNSSGATLSNMGGIVEFLLLANNSSAQQVAAAHGVLVQRNTATGAGAAANLDTINFSGSVGATAIDSTSAQTLAVSVQFSSNSASDSITMHLATIEAITG